MLGSPSFSVLLGRNTIRSGEPGVTPNFRRYYGTEFHGYERIERRTGVTFYFARPYHSWERGSNENANGLIRQYLPKGKSMAALSQQQCNAIARKLNTRPRKRLGFRTPLECFNES